VSTAQGAQESKQSQLATPIHSTHKCEVGIVFATLFDRFSGC
jgi:hypothetical protein